MGHVKYWKTANSFPDFSPARQISNCTLHANFRCRKSELTLLQLQVVPFTRQANRRSSHAHQHRISFQSSRNSGKEETSYWGVVLQSKVSSGDSGCYILKTTHTGVGDCTCVHWTLTRVCRGASLFDQVTSAWLV